jgi:hypothetical protein
MYEVYQLPFEVAQRLMEEKSTSPFMYRGVQYSDSPYEYTKQLAEQLFEKNGYRAVAKFNVDSLEAVFEASGMGKESVIERLNQMHTVSVGDIIRDVELDDYFIVNPMGFDFMGKLRRAV